MPHANAFNSDSLQQIVEAASRAAGLSADGARLLRIGENAIYRLAHDPVVMRIARSAARMDTARRELCVARWLERNAVPTIKVHEVAEQPLLIEGHPVTFWRAVSGPNDGDRSPDRTDLARLLLAFHGARDCPCELPTMAPSSWAKVEERISAATGIDAEAREFLNARNAELAEKIKDLDYALPRGPIHADAYTGNLLTDDGVIVLSDYRRSPRNSTFVYRHCGSLNLSDGGVSSKPTPLIHPSSAAGADPAVKRTTVRITNVYATS